VAMSVSRIFFMASALRLVEQGVMRFDHTKSGL
jgi:hypothetical protein